MFQLIDLYITTRGSIWEISKFNLQIINMQCTMTKKKHSQIYLLHPFIMEWIAFLIKNSMLNLKTITHFIKALMHAVLLSSTTRSNCLKFWRKEKKLLYKRIPTQILEIPDFYFFIFLFFKTQINLEHV